MTLISVAEAQRRLLALAPIPQATEQRPLLEALGHWLADDVRATRTQPWTNLSAMDGYAIRMDELPGPWRVVGESTAGTGPLPPLEPGTAFRIFTGAPVPPGADAVMVQEEARREGDQLWLDGEGPTGPLRNIRPTGSDFSEGDLLLTAGQRLTAPALGLAAVGGHGTVPVRPKVRVAILSTGNELVPAGSPVAPGQLPSSNAIVLAALLGSLPVEVIDLGIIGDDLAAQTEAFRDAAARADLIVTTGGASVGDHDLVRPAFAAAGGSLDFWRIAMQPGKPLMAGTLSAQPGNHPGKSPMMAGTLGTALFVGLPGNPVSAFVTANLFLLPLIRHIAGATDPLPRAEPAITGDTLPATSQRAQYLRATLSNGIARLVASQDSGALRALNAADILIVRPPESAEAQAGDPIEVLRL